MGVQFRLSSKRGDGLGPENLDILNGSIRFGCITLGSRENLKDEQSCDLMGVYKPQGHGTIKRASL